MNEIETQGRELADRGGNYSPVHVINNDTVGALMLGIIALVLLVAYLRQRAQR